MVMKKLHGFLSIISKEIIKPFSPTPPHLKTYNLSFIDQLAIREYIPMVLFYPNFGHSHTSRLQNVHVLKNSLSKTITQYYPFAGRFDPVGGAVVDCNDEGVEFVEAHVQAKLSDFVQAVDHESLAPLFPANFMGSKPSCKDTSSVMVVRLNHFTCGGVALAVSMLHKIGDASTICNFLNYWANVAAFTHQHDTSSHYHDQVVPIPHFLTFKRSNHSIPEHVSNNGNDCVTKSFVFPNSKISYLKAKVMSMAAESGQYIKSLTRLEVLSSLLYKCAAEATTESNRGIFKPSVLKQVVNMRNVMVEPLPTTSVGNIIMTTNIPTRCKSEVMLDSLTAGLQKGKMQLRGIRNWDAVIKMAANYSSSQLAIRDLEEVYTFTGTGRFPVYVDFGWGKPINVTTMAAGYPMKNCFILMDTLSGDGIKALVTLEKEDMTTFENYMNQELGCCN